MTTDWSPLRQVLRQFRTDGADLPIWWRDDDAIAPTQELDRLHDISARLSLPVHIAVIPGLAHATLVQRMSGTDQMVPIVHGWQHQNHAPEGAKTAEFGSLRPSAATEIASAMTRMRTLFEEAFLPVFVPPWNRIDPALGPVLVSAGFRGLSTFTPRVTREAAPNLVRVNCHIDPIDWRGTRGLIAPDQIIAATVSNLTRRLHGETDSTEPFGYLTHHLVHTPALWDFTESYLTELLEGGASVQSLAPLLETPP